MLWRDNKYSCKCRERERERDKDRDNMSVCVCVCERVRVRERGVTPIICFVQHTDMPEEMRVETMELCVTACEKFATNNEVCVCVWFYYALASPLPACCV